MKRKSAKEIIKNLVEQLANAHDENIGHCSNPSSNSTLLIRRHRENEFDCSYCAAIRDGRELLRG